MKPVLVLVLGIAGTGKTTLAGKLSEELKLPLVVKDDLKIIISKNLDLKKRAWSKKIGEACYEILFHLTEKSLKVGQSIIIESTFTPKFANPQFKKLRDSYNFTVVQVFCYADAKIARQRFDERASSDKHHPSFGEGDEGKENFDYRLRNKLDQSLELEGLVIRSDRTVFSKVDDNDIVDR